VNQDVFIPAMGEIPNPFIFLIIISDIGNTELPHKFADIGQRCFQEKVEMVGHEYITIENNMICI